MPPRRPAVDRVPELVDAAVRVFAEKGYRATQMADVAAALGTAPGSLYNYVESKDGLFALCLDWLSEGPAPDISLPFATPPLEVTLKRMSERGEESLRLPALSAAAEARSSSAPLEELRTVVTELYDLVSRTRQAADMIERSARDLPALAALFRDEWRTPLIERLETYLGARMRGGDLRRVGDVGVAARFVVETITWFARHRFHDPDACRLDEAATETTVIDLVVGALAPCSARGDGASSR